MAGLAAACEMGGLGGAAYEAGSAISLFVPRQWDGDMGLGCGVGMWGWDTMWRHSIWM